MNAELNSYALHPANAYVPNPSLGNEHPINNSTIVISQEEPDKLINKVIEKLCSLDDDKMDVFNGLFSHAEWDGGNNCNSIQDAINTLKDIQNAIHKNDRCVDENNKLIVAANEQFSRINNFLRNQNLYFKHMAAELNISIKKVLKYQEDIIPANRSKREALIGSEDQEEITTQTSYAEIWRRLAVAIGEIKTDYVDFYATLMQKYTEMYESFNTNVQKASSDAVSTGDDGNNVAFDIKKMQAGYDAFQKDIDRLNQELGSVTGWDNMSSDAKKSMKITLEPAFEVDDKGKISFNTQQYNTVSGGTPSGINKGKVSTASYQAWLATFNSAGNSFQSNMQSFAQRYSQANNTFDNINKVLSGTISTLADSARDVLKSLS